MGGVLLMEVVAVPGAQVGEVIVLVGAVCTVEHLSGIGVHIEHIGELLGPFTHGLLGHSLPVGGGLTGSAVG